MAGYSSWGHKESDTTERLTLGFAVSLRRGRAALVPQTVKTLPAMQDFRVRSLGPEDPLEKGMATHSNILAWKIPWTEEPGGLHSMGLQSSTRPSD